MTATPNMLNHLFSLEGKAALITGASGGIGSALAIGFAEAGAAIAVHGRDVTRVEETCHAIETVGGRALPLIADLNNVQECRNLVTRTHRELGRLDILINNAATNRRKPILEVTEDDYEVITGVNTRAIFFLSQAAHRPMCDQGSGKIIHIASINVSFALDTVSVYGLSKGAVAQMTKAMAVEWARDNIQVNAITPGFVYTPLAKPIWDDPHKAAWLTNRIPMRRPAQPTELLGLAMMLASHASDYITGQNIVIDGGFSAGGSWNADAQ
jgi:NAD(P)-dependent dehydrogenase (short-subunit alcohol dehydrogenase family)